MIKTTASEVPPVGALLCIVDGYVRVRHEQLRERERERDETRLLSYVSGKRRWKLGNVLTKFSISGVIDRNRVMVAAECWNEESWEEKYVNKMFTNFFYETNI